MQKVLMGTALIAASFVWVTPVDAQNERDINPWRDCGIGAIIFPDNPTAAAISNIIWDSGTTAVSSATTTPNACEGEEIQIAQFIDYSYEALVLDTAQGAGEHLSSLFSLAECEVQAPMVDGLRADLSALTADESFGAMERAEKAFQYYSSFLNVTAEHCTVG